MSEINIRETPEYKSAMEKARCEAKGRDAITGKECEIHIHHIKPIAKYPELACDPNNLIPINAEIHINFVHNGNWKCLKGLTEEQIKAYQKLHLECEGVRAPFPAIKKETYARFKITKEDTKKETPIAFKITEEDIKKDPHKYHNIPLPAYLRTLCKKLIYEENTTRMHFGYKWSEWNSLSSDMRASMRAQYDALQGASQ